ncbi:hypothetical protein FB468_2665 [Leucobacter komagatae]|uniref:Transcriptional regulator, AbiEi antitoxin, Type IV TA system n=1 Tax=Leucobacter komagatae TaxID=55969 RepID=A0A542Y9C8_9MICO|nr:hypothetical protein [Leucobacter komagatae]TQL44604.1 hypothetical protein FB468_2665 [Leucobacter komagatae]
MTSAFPAHPAIGELVASSGLYSSGLTRRELAVAVRAGALVRVRYGWYVSREVWEQLPAADRHLLTVLAANRSALEAPTFSHRSAATLHGLPVWSPWLHAAGSHGARSAGSAGSRRQRASASGPDPSIAHTTVSPPGRVSSSRALVRHSSALPDADVEAWDELGRQELSRPLRLTTADRTLADLAATAPFTVALACADHYLREIARVGRQIDVATVAEWRDAMLHRSALKRGRPGSLALFAVALLADPRADSPLETLSRLRFAQLGVDVELQVPVHGRDGRSSFFLDFELSGRGFWGEADGKQKYVGAETRRGRSADEVVYAEKRRAEWIAGSTGLKPIRWGASEVLTLAGFSSHLEAHGVQVPGTPSLRWGPGVAGFLRGLP